jgi:PiT family inorganic phosphate transporter
VPALWKNGGKRHVQFHRGGWRIIRTLGLRLTALRPIHGFSAEAAAASAIEAASRIGIPIRTARTISASVIWAGATSRLSAIKGGIGIEIIVAWILTPRIVAR